MLPGNLQRFMSGWSDAVRELMRGCRHRRAKLRGVRYRVCSGRVVPPGQLEDLVEAITELRDDPVLARQWGEAGRRHVQERFGREEMIKKLETWYTSLLESGNRSDM